MEPRNFYKQGGSYYFADNHEKILNLDDLTTASQSGTEVLPPIDQEYYDALVRNPLIKNLVDQGATPHQIVTAVNTGDFSVFPPTIKAAFTPEQEQAAREAALKDDQAYFDMIREKDKADAEAKLASNQANYQDYLIQAGQQFETDKASLDQQSADRGVLFSGARAQKQRNLKQAYEQNDATNRRKTGENIASIAQPYQYAHGNEAASALGDYYKLGSNAYNPNKALSNVGSGGISNLYNPDKYKNFYGTTNTYQQALAAQGGARKLENEANKMMGSGYNYKI